MDKYAKKIILLFTVSVVMVASFAGCSNSADNPQTENGKIHYENETHIILSDNGVTANGKPVGEKGKVYLSNDVIYYEDKDSYESGNPYGEGTDADKHTADEAAATTVVNITEAGFYRLSGKLGQGQIRVDLGKDADEDENAVVTLVLDGLDINCDVAPAVVFMNVYECDNSWDAETATSIVDTSDAGANVIIADGSINNIEGAYVAKIYKDKDGEKKLWKQDGAVYSYMSMNIDGEKDGTGILNITADNEGLGTELHLTISGGNINIYSENDGINTNEDGVSVTTVNGGTLNINVLGTTGEGDGIDSNGWLVINGGSITAYACMYSMDAGIDSDMGIYINGGKVLAVGNMFGRIENSGQNYAVFNFQHPLGTINPIVLENDAGESVMSVEQRYYRNIFFSSPELKTGVYTIKNSQDTLWVKANDGNMQHPGMPGEIPGETPPQMSESFDQSLDKPQKPNGEGSGIYPMNTDDYKTEFEVVDGANFYSVIEPNKIIWSD